MIGLSLEADGLASVGALLESLKRIGSVFSAVELRGLPREDATANNAEILGYLKEQKRAFSDLFPGEGEEIAKVAADELERRAQASLARAKRQAAKGARALAKSQGIGGSALTAVGKSAASGVSTFSMDEKWARETAGGILKKSMEKYMEIVSGHIEKQEAPGGVADFASDQYRGKKIRVAGFDYPIGKFTGQLLENLDIAMASRAIKLVK